MEYPSFKSLLLFMVCGCSMYSRVLGTQEGNLCENSETVLAISRDKTYEYNGRTVRLLCSGEVRVNKCEGLCLSEVWPSVNSAGYKKKCKCCRERTLKTRQVTLTKCTDEENRVVQGETYTFSITEPEGCDCYECSN